MGKKCISLTVAGCISHVMMWSLVLISFPVSITWDLEAEVALAAYVGNGRCSPLPGDALLHPALPCYLHRECAPCAHTK